MMMALPGHCLSVASSHAIPSRSRWLVGSSSRSSVGSLAIALISATRLRIPPDNVPTRASGASSSLSMRARTRDARPQSSLSGSYSPMTVSSMVSASSRVGSCSTVATRTWPAMLIAPSSGRLRPSSNRRSEDFPAPLRPINPIRSLA